MPRLAVALVWALAVTPFACGDSAAESPADDGDGGAEADGATNVDAAQVTWDAGGVLVDAASDSGEAGDARAPVSQCPPGTTNRSQTLASSVAYTATHLTSYVADTPFAPICLPITAAGQSFYLETNVIRSGCNVYDACETTLEIKCVDGAGAVLAPQVWSGENFPNSASTSSLVARLMFTATTLGPVTCRAEFYNHDHGIVGGSITVLAGSRFTATGPFSGTGATLDSGGGTHLSSAKPVDALKAITGWRMPAGMNSADYIGDVQATECHAVYPNNANNPATQCTTAESGSDSVVEYHAQAYEEDATGATCHVTDGPIVTQSITTQVHHKMLYTQVRATHTAGCANVWHFEVAAGWKGGRTFMIQSGPYGQGMVRAD